MTELKSKPASSILLTAVFFLLLVFTAMSLYFGRIHYESYAYYIPFYAYLAHLNDFIVIGTACLQALLVLFIFMRIFDGKMVYSIYILGSTALIIVICSILITDGFYQGTAEAIEGVRLLVPAEIGQ